MHGLFRKKITVLMVCSANICRSPIAQGVLEQLIRERGLKNRIRVDSAGTHVPRIGTRPDPRAIRAAEECGISIKRYRSRMLAPADYERCDYIVAMDQQNLGHMRRECPQEYSHKLSSVIDYLPGAALDEVPDPYFGNQEGFQRVVDLLQPACSGFLDYLSRERGLS